MDASGQTLIIRLGVGNFEMVKNSVDGGELGSGIDPWRAGLGERRARLGNKSRRLQVGSRGLVRRPAG